MRLYLRILFYILGIFCLSCSMPLAVSASLGMFPASSFPYILSSVTNISLSVFITLVFSLYVLLQIIILGKEFKWINLFQLVFSALLGYFVELTTMIFSNWLATTYLERFIQLALSILLSGLGVVLYINTELMTMPPEGFMLAILRKKPGLSLGKLRIMHDSTILLLTCAISLIAFKEIRGIREGTLIAALFCGMSIELFSKLLRKPIRRSCLGEITNERLDNINEKSTSRNA